MHSRPFALQRYVEEQMAKVVYAPGVQMDPRLMAEVLSLRARVRQLEQENDALRLENAAFDEEVRTLSVESTVLA